MNFHNRDDGNNLVEQNRLKLPAGNKWHVIATGGPQYGHKKPGNGYIVYRNGLEGPRQVVDVV